MIRHNHQLTEPRFPAPLLLCAAVLLLALSAQPVSAEGEVCERVHFAEAPAWATSILQSSDGRSLVVSDPAAAALVRFSLDGRRVEELKGGDGSDFRPSTVSRTKDGYVVETGLARFVEVGETAPRRLARKSAEAARFEMLDADALLKTKGRVVELESGRLGRDLAGSNPRRGDIATIYGWTLLDDRSLLGYADILLADSTWTTGIVHASLRPGASHEFRVLHEISLKGLDRTMLIYSRNLFGFADGKGYVMLYDEGRPGIFVFDPAAVDGGEPRLRRLADLPSPYDRRLELPSPSGPAGMTAIFGALAHSTVGVEIHPTPAGLYLLARDYDETSGERRWYVHELAVDGDGSRIVGSVRLPTHAEHVTVAPGPVSWVVLERAEVAGHMQQSIPSMLRVPSGWIEDAGTSPLREGAFRGGLCR